MSIKRLLYLLLFAAISHLVVAESSSSEQFLFKAGYAEAIINHCDKNDNCFPVSRSGYGIFRPLEGVHDDLKVQTLVLESMNKTPLVISSLDIGGMGNKILNRIVEQAHAATGIPKQNILISSSHTHTAPDFQGVYGGVNLLGLDNQYLDKVIDAVVSSIEEAYKNKVDVTLSVAKGSSRGFVKNDRHNNEYIDYDFYVFTATKTDGSRLAILGNYAVHPVIVGASKCASADMVHYLREKIASDLDTPFMYVNGVQGDVGPIYESQELSKQQGPFNYHNYPKLMHNFIAEHQTTSVQATSCPDGRWAEAKQYGETIAQHVQTIMQDSERVVSKIEIQSENFKQPVTNLLYNAAALLDTTFAQWEWDIGLIKDYFQFEYDDSQPAPVMMADLNVTHVKLGDTVEIITFPGESLSRNGLRIKQNSMTSKHKVIFGLTNAAYGYFVDSDEWQDGGNREWLALDKSVGDNIREHICKMLDTHPSQCHTPPAATH